MKVTGVAIAVALVCQALLAQGVRLRGNEDQIENQSTVVAISTKSDLPEEEVKALDLEGYVKDLFSGAGCLHDPFPLATLESTVSTFESFKSFSWNIHYGEECKSTQKRTPGGFETWSAFWNDCIPDSKGAKTKPIIREAVEVGAPEDGMIKTIHEQTKTVINGGGTPQDSKATFERQVTATATVTVTKNFGISAKLPLSLGTGTWSTTSTKTQTNSEMIKVVLDQPIKTPAKACSVATLKVTAQERRQDYIAPTYLQGAIVGPYNIPPSYKLLFSPGNKPELRAECFWYKPTKPEGDLVYIKAQTTHELIDYTLHLEEYQLTADGKGCDKTKPLGAQFYTARAN